MEKFKPYKDLKEMIQYLKVNKNIVFNQISEDEATEILYKYNYINVITPFKHRFAKKGENKEPIKNEKGQHIYEFQVDFKQYYDAYLKEREKYPKIYKRIIEFETIFNSIVSYEIIRKYDIIDKNRFLDMIKRLRNRIQHVDSDNRSVYYTNCLEHITNKIDEYQTIYLLLDRLTLNECITVYTLSDEDIKIKIFNELKKRNCTLNTTSLIMFDTTLRRLVYLRNTICHCNSLEILVRYFIPAKKLLRKGSDRKDYRRLIKRLSE